MTQRKTYADHRDALLARYPHIRLHIPELNEIRFSGEITGLENSRFMQWEKDVVPKIRTDHLYTAIQIVLSSDYLFPAPPPDGLLPSCAEAGIIGVLTGVIGTLQAMEVIKLVTGTGEPLIGRLLLYDALAARFETIAYRAKPGG